MQLILRPYFLLRNLTAQNIVFKSTVSSYCLKLSPQGESGVELEYLNAENYNNKAFYLTKEQIPQFNKTLINDIFLFEGNNTRYKCIFPGLQENISTEESSPRSTMEKYFIRLLIHPKLSISEQIDLFLNQKYDPQLKQLVFDLKENVTCGTKEMFFLNYTDQAFQVRFSPDGTTNIVAEKSAERGLEFEIKPWENQTLPDIDPKFTQVIRITYQHEQSKTIQEVVLAKNCHELHDQNFSFAFVKNKNYHFLIIKPKLTESKLGEIKLKGTKTTISLNMKDIYVNLLSDNLISEIHLSILSPSFRLELNPLVAKLKLGTLEVKNLK